MLDQTDATIWNLYSLVLELRREIPPWEVEFSTSPGYFGYFKSDKSRIYKPSLTFQYQTSHFCCFSLHFLRQTFQWQLPMSIVKRLAPFEISPVHRWPSPNVTWHRRPAIFDGHQWFQWDFVVIYWDLWWFNGISIEFTLWCYQTWLDNPIWMEVFIRKSPN